MSPIHAIRSMRCSAFVGLLSLSATLPMITPQTGSAAGTSKPACVINFIGHETTNERTRVIMHANTAIDYRGGSLHGDQVVLDLANVEVSLPATTIEVGTPEVNRVVIGPEVSRDGERMLKVRLVGVHATSHKVESKGNELYVDLIPLKGARDGQKGMPKLINNDSEITASIRGSRTPVVKWARATPVAGEGTDGQTGTDEETEPAAMAGTDPATSPAPSMEEMAANRTKPIKMMAIPAEEPTVTPIKAAAPSTPAAPATTETMKQPPAERSGAESLSASPVASVPAAVPAAPVTPMPMVAAPADEAGRTLRVSVGRSTTLETAVPVARVSISNPAVAEPIVISPTQLLINGLAPGVVSLVLWPKQGAPMVYETVVQIDTTGLAQQLETMFPREKVHVQTSKDSIMLSGEVSDAAVGEKMVKLAGDYSAKVVNDLTSPGLKRKQVLLKVKFAEVSKDAMAELASMWTHVDAQHPGSEDRGNVGTGQFVPPFGNLINNPPGPDTTWSDAINLSYFDKRINLGLFITALKSRGLFQELAEPNLIAASGQEANFLAGGEFPVPIAQPGANFVSVTIEWKKFGIMLDFKPTIGEDGTIVMKVKPEVSTLDFSNGVLLQGFRIPSLIVRRAETEVELKDGQSFAIAGLYDRTLLQTKQRIPILGDIPILGYLFRSKAIQKKQAELLVIVTPTIVQPLGVGDQLPSIPMPESMEIDKHGSKSKEK